MQTTHAKYNIGQVVRHRERPFRGVVFDVDPIFANSDDWYDSLPEEGRPHRDQPFYHLLAETGEDFYIAYVSEQNLEADRSGEPVGHPDLPDLFGDMHDGIYALQVQLN
ncbi:heat shock protein HspQ [Rhodobacteraceae bacterium]|nr:heat shock protein HspQ [Paracoccaceae bacterium]